MCVVCVAHVCGECGVCYSHVIQCVGLERDCRCTPVRSKAPAVRYERMGSRIKGKELKKRVR